MPAHKGSARRALKVHLWPRKPQVEVVRRNCSSFRRITLYGSDGVARTFLIQSSQTVSPLHGRVLLSVVARRSAAAGGHQEHSAEWHAAPGGGVAGTSPDPIGRAARW